MKQLELSKEEWNMIHYSLMAVTVRKCRYYHEYSQGALAKEFEREWKRWDDLAKKVENETT